MLLSSHLNSCDALNLLLTFLILVTTGPEFVKTAQGNELLADTLNPSNKFSASYHEITNLSQQHFKSETAEEHKLSSEETNSSTETKESPPSLECKYY